MSELNSNADCSSATKPSIKPDHHFARVRFIMMAPSHPGNVGAAARAIKTMGFQQLTLVAPRCADVASHPDALARASGANDILATANIVSNLDAAMQDVTLAFALSARTRDLGPPQCDIRQAAQYAAQHLHQHSHSAIAIVLGTERTGLTNTQIAQCQRICTIPANPLYSSLNVAQALQLAAWEIRYALQQHPTTNPKNSARAAHHTQQNEPLADNAAIQALLTHWETALIQVQFLDPLHPKKLMLRMRHWLLRSQLTQTEVAMLRGVCTAMINTSTQTRAKHNNANCALE